MKSILVVGLLMAVALSGCTDGSDGTGPGTDEGEGTDDEVLQIQKPEWQVGDWWTFDSTFGSQTVVVTGEDGGNWVMDTDNVQFAFFHSTFQEISYLGEVRKDDLAGSQDGTPVKYFDWPLEQDKTWTTQWDGLQFDMVAHVADDGTAHIAATSAEATYDIVYKESAKWFTSISFKDAEGTETGRMDLTDSGSGFTGEAIRVDAVVAIEGSHSGPAGTANADIDASGATDDADAYLMHSLSCEVGEFAFGVGTAEGSVAGNTGGAVPNEPQGRSVTSPCPFSETYAGVIGTAPANGDQWGMYMQSSSPDFEIEYTLYWRNFERITL